MRKQQEEEVDDAGRQEDGERETEGNVAQNKWHSKLAVIQHTLNKYVLYE